MNNWYDKTGIFIEESLNRFICLVSVEGEVIECYVQSSCRLDNFIDLKTKIVFLKKIHNPRRAKYILVGFKFGRSKVILSPKLANDLFLDFLNSKKSSYIGDRKNIKREYKIDNYKSDFYIPSTKKVFEVKAVIDFQNVTKFPSVFSERALKQLDKIEKLLDDGFDCYYEIISLNPLTKSIEFAMEQKLSWRLKGLVNKGLIIEFKKVLCKKDVLELVCI